MGKKCPKCGHDGNAPEWEFCGLCGCDLTAEPVQPPEEGKTSTQEPIGGPGRGKSKPIALPAARAKLVVMRKGEEGREFTIEKDEAAIGRWDIDAEAYPDIDLAEDDPNFYVSRHHARVFVKGGRYFIEDLGSTNKTVVNKTNKLNPHSPVELKNGDEVIVGKTFLKFVIEY